MHYVTSIIPGLKSFSPGSFFVFKILTPTRTQITAIQCHLGVPYKQLSFDTAGNKNLPIATYLVFDFVHAELVRFLEYVAPCSRLYG